MNVRNNEGKAEERAWHELAPAELPVIEGGSPTLPLPPPSAFRSYPIPTPWIPQVVSLGGYLDPPQPW
jgi:hypothetical protein